MDPSRNGAALKPTSPRFQVRVHGALHPLAIGENVVGRGEGCDVVVHDTSASRRHARLIVGGTVTIEDLESAHGTLVNGSLLRGTRSLVPGDRFTVGGTELDLLEARPISPSETSLRPTSRGGDSVTATFAQLVALEEAVARRDLRAAESAATAVVSGLTRHPLGSFVLARLEAALLALSGDDPFWLERILELRAVDASVPSAEVAVRIETLATGRDSVGVAQLEAYVTAISDWVPHLGPVERRIHERIEAALRRPPT